jgi:hypothetical protein
MSTVTVDYKPQRIDFEFAKGDTLNALLDFDISLVGYTFDVSYDGGTFDVTNTNLALGQVSIKLTGAKSALLDSSLPPKWYFRWTVGGETRTIFTGYLKT